MSKNKSKIVKWEYVTEPFDVLVIPATVKRVHSPLGRSLSPHYTNGEFYLHLRPCVQGVDEYGAVVKYLYCTRDGRFFVRGKEGWDEVKPCTRPHAKFTKSNHHGTTNSAMMRNFGGKTAHRCVAFAWCNPPENATKLEVDHLNCDHANWTADNLQWVTPAENRRRGKITNRLKNKAGINPKLLTPTLCKSIYTLPEDMIEPFISTCSEIFARDPLPLSAEAIRLDVALSLDILKQQLS